MSKIFVRHRRHVGRGAGRPRFAIVAVQGTDLHIFKTRVRRAELEKLAQEAGAEIVFLPRGEQEGEAEEGWDLEEGGGRKRRRKKNRGKN